MLLFTGIYQQSIDSSIWNRCLPPSNNDPLPWQMTRHIKKAVLPFLRCATVLYHNLTGVPIPAQLQGKSSIIILYHNLITVPIPAQL